MWSLARNARTPAAIAPIPIGRCRLNAGSVTMKLTESTTSIGCSIFPNAEQRASRSPNAYDKLNARTAVILYEKTLPER